MMKTIFLGLLFLGLICITNSSFAQESSVDNLISSMYESISFTEDKNPDYKAFKSFFMDDGQLISVKDTTSFAMAHADYERMMNKQRKSGAIIRLLKRSCIAKQNYMATSCTCLVPIKPTLKRPIAPIRPAA